MMRRKLIPEKARLFFALIVSAIFLVNFSWSLALELVKTREF